MKFNSKLDRFATVLWDQHIEVPNEAFQQFKSDRIICTINQQVSFPCALTSKGEGVYFIRVNKPNREKLQIQLGDEVSVELKNDESKYGLPLPVEMEALLDQDSTFNAFFHALTPGKQRNLLYIVGLPKTSQTRINKAIVIANHLVSRKGKLDFKILHEDFKKYNRK